MLKKILLVSLVVIVIAVLVSPSSFNFFWKIPDEGAKVTRELTDPVEDATDAFTNGIQNAFAFMGEKIEGLAFSADIFLSKQEKNKTSSQQEEQVFFGKLNGQNTSPTVTQSGAGGGSGGSQTNNNNGNTNSATSPTIIQNPANIPPINNNISFDTLFLKTKKQSDNSVSMEYDDTSRKTINVTVQIRNEAQVLFTGQYFSSSFETTIMDASATPHFIDLVVEHTVYGKVSATAFVPAGSTDAVIYGVFSKN
jgi:hypothetical protein